MNAMQSRKLSSHFTLSSITSSAQIPPRVIDDAPAAEWIAPPAIDGDAYGVFHFRRVLALHQKPEQFVVHVSADNRYRLLINGRVVAHGPQRSDLANWRYDTVDLAPFLDAGENVIAAVVWNWGPHLPIGQFTHRTGFLIQADSVAEAAVNTGSDWKASLNIGYAALPVTGAATGGYYAAPPGEAVDGSRYPWGWEQLTFDDSSWPSAATVAPRSFRGMSPHGQVQGWQLTPRTLPPMEEREVRFAAVRRATGVPPALPSFSVPANTKATILLDQGQLTNAFTVLELTGGSGATVTLTYAESLFDAQGRKGNRNEIEGKTIVGVQDVFRPDGGPRRRYQTLWFRTYRYVQVDIETVAEPLEVGDVHGVFTAYPFVERAHFTCELPWIADMWAMNWRVARLCAWETYFDTPYYEQLQYVGDTRIQALISYSMSGDDRLAREAIAQINRSRIPEGLTASRYPSSSAQYIPPFSLLWVAMVHDYWWYRDDEAFVREQLPGIRAVLSRYEEAVDETSLVGKMPWWNFVDWTPGWSRGVPPGADDGHSTPITLLLVYAALRAAELEDALGQPCEATRLRALADRLRARVREHLFDANRGLFSDALGASVFSQQTNVLAILTDTAPAAEQRSLMEKVLADNSLVGASFYFGFYVREALLKCGMGDHYIELLGPWQEMLRNGMTTTAETPEPTRSDSHAWSAHPNFGLLATVLGIRPGAPGFAKIVIAPNLGPLKTAEGALPHPRGNVAVKLTRASAGVEIEAEITLPDGVEGVFECNGHSTPLHPGAQRIKR